MAKNSTPSFDEITELIVAAIRDEPFFTKDVLIPKVRGIIKGFNLKLNYLNSFTLTAVSSTLFLQYQLLYFVNFHSLKFD